MFMATSTMPTTRVDPEALCETDSGVSALYKPFSNELKTYAANTPALLGGFIPTRQECFYKA